MPDNQKHYERIVYALQGGGALGSYQVGVYQGLAENGYVPDWIIGTSIGAINASIIAGNEPQDRMIKLHEFWSRITCDYLPGYTPNTKSEHKAYNWLSAQMSIIFGVPGFFSPRVNNPLFELFSTPDRISFYTITPLRETLQELINFDLINTAKIRLTLGAVEVKRGVTTYFDNSKQKITVDHILASCALPPGLPAIKINNKYYWDGGVLSNAPTDVLLRETSNVNTLCFLAHMFDSYGLNPKNLDDVIKRHKDIIYSSHYRTHAEVYQEIHHLRYMINKLYRKLPEDLKANPFFKKIHQDNANTANIHFVRFLYMAPDYELSSKDYEFSKISMHERFNAGYKDAINAIKESPWINRLTDEVGIEIHEFYHNFSKLHSIEIDEKMK
jgi:NTE family protein